MQIISTTHGPWKAYYGLDTLERIPGGCSQGKTKAVHVTNTLGDLGNLALEVLTKYRTGYLYTSFIRNKPSFQ